MFLELAQKPELRRCLKWIYNRNVAYINIHVYNTNYPKSRLRMSASISQSSYYFCSSSSSCPRFHFSLPLLFYYFFNSYFWRNLCWHCCNISLNVGWLESARTLHKRWRFFFCGNSLYGSFTQLAMLWINSQLFSHMHAHIFFSPLFQKAFCKNVKHKLCKCFFKSAYPVQSATYGTWCVNTRVQTFY